MSQLDRQPKFIRGAHFHRENGVDMFTFGIDPSNRLGPRKATKADMEQFSGEWEDYQRRLFNGADPAKFDHDDSGFPGGDAAAKDEASEDAIKSQLRPVSDDHKHVEPRKRRGRPPKAQP